MSNSPLPTPTAPPNSTNKPNNGRPPTSPFLNTSKTDITQQQATSPGMPARSPVSAASKPGPAPEDLKPSSTTPSVAPSQKAPLPAGGSGPAAPLPQPTQLPKPTTAPTTVLQSPKAPVPVVATPKPTVSSAPAPAPTPTPANAPLPVQPVVKPPAPVAPVPKPMPAVQPAPVAAPARPAPTAPVGPSAPVATPRPTAPIPAANTAPGTSPVPRSPVGLPPMPAPPTGMPVAPPAKPVSPPPPPTGNTPTGGKSPVLASPKKSPLRFLPFIVIGLLVLGIIGFIATQLLGGSKPQTSGKPSSDTGSAAKPVTPSKQVVLTYWGLWEPSEVMTGVLKEYEQANQGVTIQYVKQSPKDYRERLQTAIASGNGPDLFRFHATWVPMLKNELAPMPSSFASLSEFQKLFYPVAAKQLQSGGQLAGVPLMYDGLALLYNKDVLATAGVQPPTTWSELRTLSTQLTIRSSSGIQRAGLAIGTTGNVDHFSDILGLLMLQNGANLTNPTTVEAKDALTFYTNFSKVDKVWDSTLPNSTVAFARGEVAMIFAPSWRIHEIQALNPDLQFGVAPVPQLAETKTTWATYWAEGVSAQSKNKDEAWKLLKFLSSSEVMQKLYSAQRGIRSFGEPYSRVDIATGLATDANLAPYLSDAPAAQGWYLSSNTFDNGINDQIIQYFEDAVNAMNTGDSAEDVVVTLDSGVKQVLRQYGVPVTATTTK